MQSGFTRGLQAGWVAIYHLIKQNSRTRIAEAPVLPSLSGVDGAHMKPFNKEAIVVVCFFVAAVLVVSLLLRDAPPWVKAGAYVFLFMTGPAIYRLSVR